MLEVRKKPKWEAVEVRPLVAPGEEMTGLFPCSCSLQCLPFCLYFPGDYCHALCRLCRPLQGLKGPTRSRAIFVQAPILRVKGQEVFIVGEARAELMAPGPSMVCLVFFWFSRDELTRKASLGPVSLSPGGPSCLPSGDFLLCLRVLLVAFLEHIHTADPAAQFLYLPFSGSVFSEVSSPK